MLLRTDRLFLAVDYILFVSNIILFTTAVYQTVPGQNTIPRVRTSSSSQGQLARSTANARAIVGQSVATTQVMPNQQRANIVPATKTATTTVLATQPIPPPRGTYKLASHIRNPVSQTLQYATISQQVNING